MVWKLLLGGEWGNVIEEMSGFKLITKLSVQSDLV